MPKWHILAKSLLFVKNLMMDLFLFENLFTHLVECTVIISIKNSNVISKYYVFSCFPKTLKYDLGNYAIRLTISNAFSCILNWS